MWKLFRCFSCFTISFCHTWIKNSKSIIIANWLVRLIDSNVTVTCDCTKRTQLKRFSFGVLLYYIIRTRNKKLINVVEPRFDTSTVALGALEPVKNEYNCSYGPDFVSWLREMLAINRKANLTIIGVIVRCHVVCTAVSTVIDWLHQTKMKTLFMGAHVRQRTSNDARRIETPWNCLFRMLIAIENIAKMEKLSPKEKNKI